MRKISILLLALIFVSILGCAGNRIAFAADETIYSDVLEDLQKDETFDLSQYPENVTDYSLNLFQIAESNDKELFVYIYQPSGDKITASEIRLSTSIEQNFSAKDYPLKLLSRSGTLCKYLVEGLTVLDDVVRYYEIVQVVRPWDAALETYSDVHMSGATQTPTTVPYDVSKRFTATTLDGVVTYTELHAETITVTGKFVGFVRYESGFSLWKDSACDSHFVAFSTDKPIDKLISAKLSYTYQSYTRNWVALVGVTEFFGDKVVISEDVVTCEERATYAGEGLFSKTYTWPRIETAQDFLDETLAETTEIFTGTKLDVTMGEVLTEAAKTELLSKQWVLRFEETPYTVYTGNGSSSIKASIIEEVTILQLTFETEGSVYNLGVVDNKQSGSKDPVGTVDGTLNELELLKKQLELLKKQLQSLIDTLSNFFNRLGIFINEYWWVVVLVLGLLVLGVLCIVAKPVLVVVKYVLIVLWYILTAPIQLIVLIVRKAKEKKG